MKQFQVPPLSPYLTTLRFALVQKHCRWRKTRVKSERLMQKISLKGQTVQSRTTPLPVALLWMRLDSWERKARDRIASTSAKSGSLQKNFYSNTGWCIWRFWKFCFCKGWKNKQFFPTFKEGKSHFTDLRGIWYINVSSTMSQVLLWAVQRTPKRRF